MKKVVLGVCVSLIILSLKAQDKPIDQWQSYYSYNASRCVALAGNRIFSAGENLFSYDLLSGDYTVYSKVNKLSDVGIRRIAWNTEKEYLLIVYNNGNIDFLEDENIYNLPDIKNLNITGSKLTNQIFFYKDLIYLSTDFGVVVINPEKKEVKETYSFYQNGQLVNIHDFTVYRDTFVAAGNAGLYAIPTTSTALQDFSNWDRLDTNSWNFVDVYDNAFYLGNEYDVYTGTLHSTHLIYQDTIRIVSLDFGDNRVYLSQNQDNFKRLMELLPDGTVVQGYVGLNPYEVIEKEGIWVADGWLGLHHIEPGGGRRSYHPEGPYSGSFFNLAYANNKIWVMAGAHQSWIYTYSSGGLASYDFTSWENINQTVYPDMTGFYDIICMAVDPRNGNIYAGSYGEGLMEVTPEREISIIKNNGYLSETEGDPGSVRVSGLAFDDDHNLWIGNYGATKQLAVKKADGSWFNYSLAYPTGSERTISDIVIDHSGQKWLCLPRGIGVGVFNENGTIDHTADDKFKVLRTGAGYGNLSSNDVNCLAKDNNGAIWIGTADGISIINCPESIFSTQSCEAELKIVQYDENAGLLFQNENVKTIAVDGANNKWVGTLNGVWLISDDAETILKRFHTKNSPLPSDVINKIVVHPVTGDVFIATQSGMVSYRAYATEGASTQDNLMIFPNPVPPHYSGMIAIKGLTTNADVRITDINGQLVYRTTAQGGQAVWDGKNYKGQRPNTGMYYVFVTNKDGSQTKVGNFIFNE